VLQLLLLLRAFSIQLLAKRSSDVVLQSARHARTIALHYAIISVIGSSSGGVVRFNCCMQMCFAHVGWQPQVQAHLHAGHFCCTLENLNWLMRSEPSQCSWVQGVTHASRDTE
jgi:hypothetical protein